MDFVTVVDQAIALLRQRGRVTYRTLQLQFTLDDAQLAALKDELPRAAALRGFATGANRVAGAPSESEGRCHCGPVPGAP